MKHKKQSMTKEEFVEMLTLMAARTTDGVLAARCKEDVGARDVDLWASLLMPIHGKLYVDDSDDEPVREGGTTSTPLYALDEIDMWRPGLFEKLSGYTWWIDPKDEINLLDVIATQAGISK